MHQYTYFIGTLISLNEKKSNKNKYDDEVCDCADCMQTTVNVTMVIAGCSNDSMSVAPLEQVLLSL